jgi:hypothetical protein
MRAGMVRLIGRHPQQKGICRRVHASAKHFPLPGVVRIGRPKEDAAMRKMIFGLMSVAAVVVAAPAWSQDVYVGGGRSGVEIGVGPRHDSDWRYRHRYGVSRDECRVTRERIETPDGRVIYRTKREC